MSGGGCGGTYAGPSIFPRWLPSQATVYHKLSQLSQSSPITFLHWRAVAIATAGLVQSLSVTRPVCKWAPRATISTVPSYGSSAGVGYFRPTSAFPTSIKGQGSPALRALLAEGLTEYSSDTSRRH